MSIEARETFGGIAVEYDAVEGTLRSLWKEAATPIEGGRPPVTKVTTLNLVILVASAAEAEGALSLAADLCAIHPARVLLVHATKGKDGVEAFVSAQCHLAGGGRQVCSEQVRLVASGAAASHVAQVVAPLLVPDLPTVLWLPSHPFQLPVDDDLLGLADRVIVDARSFPDTVAALNRLASWAEKFRVVVDLAWHRLERWRALTVQLFEDPEARCDLSALERVEVDYLTSAGGSPEGKVEALYYLAWIADRLGCRWEKGLHPDSRREHYAARCPGREAPLDLVLSHGPRPEGAPGDLSRVALVARGDQCRYEISRLPEREVAELRVVAPRPGPSPARVGLPTRNALELLSIAVLDRGTDFLYEQALRGARALAGDR
jgi:glucose-6-phosphate dehydrogenase assembly protein OpcA